MGAGMRVASVAASSPAECAGIRPGDVVRTVNGRSVRDPIDFLFYGSDDLMRLRVRRGERRLEMELEGYGDSGIEFEPMRLMSCGNRCVFCFVDQNPPGMRDTVYFKDEDYRFSFLHGAYVTLTSVRGADLDRIIGQRLSPLYVSVHATDPSVRRTLLGIRRDDRLMEKIDRLIDGGIRLHTQIVVCPGINDGAVLERSIRDLGARYPGIGSVAVVPVGLTAHRTGLATLQPVDADHARAAIAAVDRLRAGFLSETGEGFTFCSDEWYLRAGLPIPPAEYYGDFPQIENGVGMVRDFLDAAEAFDSTACKSRYSGGIVLATGVSMSGYIERFARVLSERSGLQVRTVTVVNRFYGESVTVSGLLTGRDIISALKILKHVQDAPDETVILPPNCLNDDGLFLDDLSPGDVSRELGVRVVQGEYDPVATFLEKEE
jgi:putative radical SAM enzyme (TIGR03279 family)